MPIEENSPNTHKTVTFARDVESITKLIVTIHTLWYCFCNKIRTVKESRCRIVYTVHQNWIVNKLLVGSYLTLIITMLTIALATQAASFGLPSNKPIWQLVCAFRNIPVLVNLLCLLFLITRNNSRIIKTDRMQRTTTRHPTMIPAMTAELGAWTSKAHKIVNKRFNCKKEA